MLPLEGAEAAPTKTPSWKNCTWVMVAVWPFEFTLTSVATAVIEVLAPELSVLSSPGETMATAGGPAMVTVVGGGVWEAVALVVEATTLPTVS